MLNIQFTNGDEKIKNETNSINNMLCDKNILH